MDQKTLIGFILIGAILLFWPTYLDIISPEKEGEEPSQISRVLSVQDAEKKDVVLFSQEEGFGSEKVFIFEYIPIINCFTTAPLTSIQSKQFCRFSNNRKCCCITGRQALNKCN